MSKIVWSAMSDGSHVHYRDGIGTVCWKNHKKSDWKGLMALVGFVGVFTLVTHLVLKANGL